MRTFPFRVIPTELGSERPIWWTQSDKWCHGLPFTVPSKVFFFNSCILQSDWRKSMRAVIFCTKYFYSVLVYKVYPHLSNGTHFSGFSYREFVNPQVSKYTSLPASFRSPDSLTHLFYWQVASRFTICMSTLLDAVHTHIYTHFLTRYLFPLILHSILTQNHSTWQLLLQTTWRPFTLPQQVNMMSLYSHVQ